MWTFWNFLLAAVLAASSCSLARILGAPAPAWWPTGLGFAPTTVALGFATAWITGLVVVPTWIRFAQRRELMDRPDARKHHAVAVPSMGGVGLYAGLLVAGLLLSFGAFHHAALIAAAGILLLTGVIDDTYDMSPGRKLLLQLAASGLAVYGGGITRLPLPLPPFMEDPLVVGILATIVIAALINALNFLDGVDGLCGGIGLINGMVLTWFFARNGQFGEAAASAAMAGAILAFLRSNVRKGGARVFLGDTGSMLVGWFTGTAGLMAAQPGLAAEAMARGLELDGIVLPNSSPGWVFDPSVLTIGLFLLPLFDTVRIVGIRVAKGLKPFSADRRHIHHVLQKSGFRGIGPSVVLWTSHVLVTLLAAVLASQPDLPVYGPALLVVFAIALSELLTFRRLGKLKREAWVHQQRMQLVTDRNFAAERRLRHLEAPPKRA